MAAKKKRRGCIGCGAPFGQRDVFLCDPCSVHYDRNCKGTTTADIIEWAAKRARSQLARKKKS